MIWKQSVGVSTAVLLFSLNFVTLATRSILRWINVLVYPSWVWLLDTTTLSANHHIYFLLHYLHGGGHPATIYFSYPHLQKVSLDLTIGLPDPNVQSHSLVLHSSSSSPFFSLNLIGSDVSEVILREHLVFVMIIRKYHPICEHMLIHCISSNFGIFLFLIAEIMRLIF